MWNTHTIRVQRDTNRPSGKPWFNYRCPTGNAEEKKIELNNAAIEMLHAQCSYVLFPCEENAFQACSAEFMESGQTVAKDLREGLEIYKNLRGPVRQRLEALHI